MLLTEQRLHKKDIYIKKKGTDKLQVGPALAA